MRPISLDFCLPNPFRTPRNFARNALLRSIIQPRRFSPAACRTQTLRLSLQQFPARQPCCLRQVFPRLQVRFYSSRRPSRPIITSFPQYNPRPITQSPVFWSGLGFVGLLIWSPIPGWVLLGGICYGFYRLFRSLKRAQNAIFGPRNGLLSTEGDGLSFIDSLFARDPRTREVAAKIQEMAMERVEQAIETNEESIRRVFPVGSGETSGEFHFTLPTEVNMVNAATDFLEKSMVDVTFEVQIKFMVYLATEKGRKGAEVLAKADVIDDGVKLTYVDVRDLRGGGKVRLKGVAEGEVEGEEPKVKESIVRGEGEGKTIDAKDWSSR